MKTGLIGVLLAIGVIVSGGASTGAAAQTSIPPLPADLLFTAATWTGGGDYPRDIIVRVDAETLEVTPFYVDNEAFEILPISWSPQGDLLAVYRVLPAIDDAYTLHPRQLCILDRAGVLQRCLNDDLTMHWAGYPDDWQHYYPVTWGTNGQTIRFETEYLTERSFSGYGKRLVEASVITGETLQVLYDEPGPYRIAPSPYLNHATVGFGRQWEAPEPSPYLVDSATGTKLDVSFVVPSLTKLQMACLPISPRGSHFTVIAGYDLASYAPGLVPPDDYRRGQGNLLLVLDTQGVIQHIVLEPEGTPAAIWYLECPGWQPDERAIVFLAVGAGESRIMRYSLTNQQLSTLYELRDWPERESNIYSPLIPSLDGTHVALTVSDFYGADRQVAVLYPDGEIRRIPSPYRFGLYPLWVPPLGILNQ